MERQQRLFIIRNPNLRDFQAEGSREINTNSKVSINNDLIHFDNEVSVVNGINVFLNFVVGKYRQTLVRNNFDIKIFNL